MISFPSPMMSVLLSYILNSISREDSRFRIRYTTLSLFSFDTYVSKFVRIYFKRVLSVTICLLILLSTKKTNLIFFLEYEKFISSNTYLQIE